MFPWKHKYTDFNSNQREETFYFHFGKHEIIELEWKTPGGIESYMKEIIATQNGQKLADMFKWLIDGSYGVKTPDGRSFMKSKEILDNFKYTNAYEDLYITLATDSTEAAKFINGIFPEAVVKEVHEQKEMAEKAGISLVPQNQVPQSNNQPFTVQQNVTPVPLVEGQETFSAFPTAPTV